MSVVKTACQLCAATCGLDVHVKDGKIVDVTPMPGHPISPYKHCPRPAILKDMVYHPDRLQHPLKKINGKWVQISWDEALDTIATKIGEVKERYGPRALILCFGFPMLAQGIMTIGFIRRFCDIYGTPNVFSVDSMCFRHRIISHILTTGRFGLADPLNSKCIIIWGQDPNNSNMHLAWRIDQSRAKGSKLIVIDPKRTSYAKEADIFAQIRPGTDCAMALGLLNVLISENLYDKEFADKWTVGFDKLAEHVKRYTPEEVEKITWVPANTIREIARMFAMNKPACNIQGTNSLDQHPTGVQTGRALVMLQTLTGNWEVAGGYVSTPRLAFTPVRLIDMMQGKPLGVDRFPIFYGFWDWVIGEGEGQAMVIPETILSGKPEPIKAAIVLGSNPVITWPNSHKTKAAFQKLDFLVVMDMFMTETAKLAHMVLPAASFLERYDICDMPRVTFGLAHVILRKKIVQIGECKHDLNFIFELAKKMGYSEYFPWKDEKEAYDYLLKPSNLTIKYLEEEKPEGVDYGQILHKDYEKKGFRTPSRKVELYSETLEKYGYDPLPTFREPPESPISTPDLAKEYPLILTTGSRIPQYTHSQLRNIPGLRQMAPEPLAEIHPDSAAKYGIKDAQIAIIETKRGSIEMKAKLNEDLLRGVVRIPHGWTEANANILTEEGRGDPITGTPPVKALLCRMRPKA